jgi:ATP-dependent RNA helicase RhlE
VSLVSPEERRFLKDISALIGKPLQLQPVPVLENGKLIEGGVLAEEKPNRTGRTRPVAPGKKNAQGKKANRQPVQTQPEPVAPNRPGKRPSLFGR